MSDVDDLLGSIFNGTDRALYRDLEGWVRGSRRFRAFATSYASKIRAKLKNVRGSEGIKDLRSELETAVLLLRDERFTVEYEKYAAAKQRGPDFTVTFKTITPFNVEVRRVRGARPAEGNAEAYVVKLMAVVCDKTAQMPPSAVNLLWLVGDAEVPEAALEAATATLRQLAEQKVDPYFRHYGYESATEFLKQYMRLSGVVLPRPGGPLVWLNPLARHRVPPPIVTAVQRLEQG
jgi:hypothetical protein